MTKFRLFGIVILSLGIIAGCGNLGENANNANREDAVIIKDSEKNGGTMQTGAGYGFTLFDLEIDVDGKDAIAVEYDVQTEKIEAEYENKLTNVKLENAKAFDEVDKLFTYILVSKATPGGDVVSKILKYYGIDAYTEFNLYIKFDDGTVTDINEKK